MSKVIEFPRQERSEEQVAYLYGATIPAHGADLVQVRDSDGNPIKPGEYYKVTPQGIERVK